MFTQRYILTQDQCDLFLDLYESNYDETFRLDWGHESRYQRLLRIDDHELTREVKRLINIEHGTVCLDLDIDYFVPHYIEVFISQYQPGEGVGWHNDRPYFEYDPPYLNKRMYNFSINLNDDYEGGRLQADGIAVPKAVGTCTMFPITSKHKVDQVQSGRRFSLIGWVYKKA
jgi:predicted 2-oxoglutarate/Fe(II)-dependent dioxygenase YbiX